jgi:transposase
LPQTVQACHELIGKLWDSVVEKDQRLKQLEERLKLNSRNSSKPPSSDGPGTPPAPRTRPKSGKRLGGQPGHKGSYRAMLPSNEVNQVVDCPPPQQCGCGGAVQADGNRDKAMRHQVFELPQIKPIVTEYLRWRGVCADCGRKHHAPLPVGVPSGQLGAKALALVGTLASEFHLTQRKVQSVLEHIMGMRFSLGTISQAHGLVAQGLAQPVRQLQIQLQQAPVCHADETRHQSHAHALWTWVQITDWGAKFTIYPSRGQAAAKAVLGPNPELILVSERYAGYNHHPIHQRQVCWAHLLRDFERIALRPGQAGQVGKRLGAYGHLLFRWRGRQRLDAKRVAWLQKRMRLALELGGSQVSCSKTANTCANLIKMWPALWTFTQNPLVEPTNNAAERALRSLVLKRKISYCTRSGSGMRFWETAMSTVQTCAIQGKSSFAYMGACMSAWLCGLHPPSLVPEHVHLHPRACF